MSDIPRVRSNELARYPVSVEFKSTENWSCKAAFRNTLEGNSNADRVAQALKATYPNLPVRICMYKQKVD